MSTSFRALMVLAAFVASLSFAGCHCDEPQAIMPSPIAEWVPQDESLRAAALLTNSTIVAGTLSASFVVDESG